MAKAGELYAVDRSGRFWEIEFDLCAEVFEGWLTFPRCFQGFSDAVSQITERSLCELGLTQILVQNYYLVNF